MNLQTLKKLNTLQALKILSTQSPIHFPKRSHRTGLTVSLMKTETGSFRNPIITVHPVRSRKIPKVMQCREKYSMDRLQIIFSDILSLQPGM